jgi:hypothetical protein
MEKPAAILAALVDMRNVGTHKSLKLTLHIAEEHALDAIRAFGWPTGANPVLVGVGRADANVIKLNTGAEMAPSAGEGSAPESSVSPHPRWGP